MGYEYNFGIGCGINGLPVDFSDKIGSAKQYVAYMLDRTQSMFEYENLPSTIPHRSLELLMQTGGFACIASVNGELYAFFGGLGGVPDAYYMPTICTVANPALNFNKMLKINEDCVIIPNDALYIGLLPMLNRYASMLAENDVTIRIADINARFISLISAADDRTLKSAKQYITDIETGKLGVVGENGFFDGVKVQPCAASGSTNNITQLIELQQYLKASWFNDLGLNANFNMKRESLNSSETQAGTDTLLPLVDDMLRCRKLGLEKVNDMFGTNISVHLASAWEDRQIKVDEMLKGEDENGTTESISEMV